MKKLAGTALAALMIITAYSLPAIAETISCSQCGMDVDLNSKFSSKIVHGDTTQYFCDIGDLFAYLQVKKSQASEAQVKDFRTGEWINAQNAFYVHAVKNFSTPMGWGIAAFREKNGASEFGDVMDFDGVAKSLK
jgi:nitrous oxide reductase accessory protein NosL